MKNVLTIAILSAAITLSAQANSINFADRDLDKDIRICEKTISAIGKLTNIFSMFPTQQAEVHDEHSSEQSCEQSMAEVRKNIPDHLYLAMNLLYNSTAEACYHAALGTRDKSHIGSAIAGYTMRGDIDTLSAICSDLLESQVNCKDDFIHGKRGELKYLKEKGYIQEKF
jgi:hypothetical protein